jgi:hypothetical protein
LIVTSMVVVSELSECVLELPEGQELVEVHSDGRSALVRKLNGRSWRLPLNAARLPQFIEIVTCSVEGGPVGTPRFELSRPRLLNDDRPIPVELSLWSVRSPIKSSQPIVKGAAAVTAADQAALKLDRLVGITEAATQRAVELPTQDGHNWYLPWAARLAVIQEQALRTKGQWNGAQAVLQVSPSEEQLTRASERLDAWLDVVAAGDEPLAWPDSDPPLDAVADENEPYAWERLHRNDDNWIHCVANGDAAHLAVDLAPNVATPRQAQLRALLVTGALAAAAIVLMRRPAARDMLYRWPQAVGLLAGLIYWAWLWPSWLGLVIAAASLWRAVHPGWPGRLVRAEGSTVLRVVSK